jgi:hypothetical protein
LICFCSIFLLCFDVLWQEPFPSATFTPFSSCNSQSAFTDIVKDHSAAMHLDVLLILCEPSPLWGEASKRKVHNMANYWMTWQWLTTNLKSNLVIDLNEWGLGGLELAPTTLDTLSSGLVHLSSLSSGDNSINWAIK